MSHTLASLAAQGLLREPQGDVSVVISGVTQDSRQVTAGDLFLVLGPVSDARVHVEDAIARGASSVAADEALALSVPTARFALDPREAMAKLATVVYGEPTRELVTIGITGTNGKTTTTWIVDEVLTALGQHPALLGTIEARGPGRREASVLTTPESDTIARFARQVKDAGASHLVMEVSSHGLALARVEGVAFEVGAFTNLTQDHLDFHGTMDAYLAAKSRLFFDFAPPACVINVDDPTGANLAQRIASERPTARVLRVSSKARDAEIFATSITPARAGMVIEAQTPAGPLHIETPMVGAHNVDNLLLAAGCILAATKPSALPSMAALGAALGAAVGAPGRLERVPTARDVAVFVDYAHTPDALEKALTALRPLTPGRLLCVFGCGGDRDQQKRPLMGRVAAERADVVVITSDNPRTEDPRAILDQIERGVADRMPIAGDLQTARGYVVRIDRREAIALAIASSLPGDTVLIAGKGHENYQILGKEKVAFDDREEARLALQRGSA